jgi:4-amino-4-deoxy-L-arabinose transferase-like glycosyltransferase
MQKVKLLFFQKQIFMVAVLLIIGIVFRLFLSSFAVTGIFWDMESYHNIALKILSGQLAVDCCQKNPGYGMVLSLIYYVFGVSNTQAFQTIQILIDVLTAYFIYLIASKIFSKKTGMLTLIIYILNPLTSSYTGIRLPEILSIFIVTLVCLILTIERSKNQKLFWFVTGLLLGILLLIRLQFYYFIIVYFIISTLLISGKIQKIKYALIFSLGFLLVSLYSIYSYYVSFNKITVVPPFSNFYHDLYMNFYGDFRYPELGGIYWKMNPEYADLANEYFTIPLNQKKEYDLKYKKLFFDRLKTDWPIYGKQVLKNIFWIWDKDHLFVYKDVFYPTDIWPVRIYNILLLLGCLLGLLRYIFENGRRVFQKPIFIFTCLLFLYVTFTFTLVSNETRHSMVLYSIIILYAGYGISKFKKV